MLLAVVRLQPPSYYLIHRIVAEYNLLLSPQGIWGMDSGSRLMFSKAKLLDKYICSFLGNSKTRVADIATYVTG